MFSEADEMSYLRKPPEELDQKQKFEGHGKKNPKIALPILINVGTHSTADAQKIIDHVRKQCGIGQKKLIAGDMQTFKNILFIKLRDPEANNDWVLIAGEWHLTAHFLDGMVRKNWRQIYEPIALHFDIKGLQYKLVMKHTSIRLRWTMIIGNAGLKWLRSIFGEDGITDPLKLLEQCKLNIPVYNFISFIFYFVNLLSACRYATQTSESDLTNGLFLGVLTPGVQRNQQRPISEGVLQNGAVLFDSEPNIRNIIRHCRFVHVSETGHWCTGTALDYAVETVRVVSAGILNIIASLCFAISVMLIPKL